MPQEPMDAQGFEARGGFFSRIPDRAKMLWAIGIVVIAMGCVLAALPLSW